MSRKKRVLSVPAARILRLFLEDPTGEHYGFEIIRLTEISSGTLYPTLRLLAEERNLLASRWETIDPVAEGRPPRRLYRLDGARTSAALDALREHDRHVSGPRRLPRSRPNPNPSMP